MGRSTPPLQRAYSLLTVKSVDEDARLIEGIASTPESDRMGDVVESRGAMFRLPMPLLWQHQADQPIGHVIAAEVTDVGIKIRAQIAKNVLPRIDEAWTLIKSGLVRGLSIGFRPLADPEPIKGTLGGLRFAKWEWLELSAVTIPANASASITVLRSLDAPYLAARAGDGSASPTTLQAASAIRPGVKLTARQDRTMTKTISEQKKDFENTRAAKAARMTDLMNGAAEKGETLDSQQSEEYDTLEKDLSSIDAHLKRLDVLEKANLAAAKPVNGETSDAGAASRAGQPVISVQSNIPPGIGFARAVKAAVVARIDGRNMLDVAKEMYPSDARLQAHIKHVQQLPHIVAQIKAAVPAGTTTETTWASALVDPTNLASEFIEFLRPATIIGKLKLRRVPFNIRVVEQTQGGTGYWVGQGAPKPVTAFGFSPVTLAFTKVAAISVITEELARFSTPSAEMLTRDSLRDVLVQRIDEDLLDPTQAGTTNVQPASLTNGLVALSSAGTNADNIRTDLGVLLRTFRNSNVRGPVALVMPDTLALTASLMANSLGQSEFPDLTAEGGTIRGIKVITSQYVANQSGAGNMVVAIAENEVFLADDGQVTIDASREASLQMLDNPTNASSPATPTTTVSMWQTNSIALRAERFINWKKRRSSAVAYMDDVNWGSVGSPS